jgi:hypothetical protein
MTDLKPIGSTCLRCDLIRPINAYSGGMVCRCTHPELDYSKPIHNANAPAVVCEQVKHWRRTRGR